MSARVCTVADGFLVFQVNHPKMSVEHYCAPWKEPRIIPFDEAANVVTPSSDGAGHRVATAELDKVRIWDWIGGELISRAEIHETLAAIAAVSPSGKLIAYGSATELTVAEVEDERQILRVPAKPQWRIAFHPSEQWLAAGAGPFGLYSLTEQPHWRELHLGGKWVPYAIQPGGHEQVLEVGFSRDGRWMWCGTNAGLRIYEWASVPREADSDLLNPRYSFNPPARADSQFATYIQYEIVEEIDAEAVVFAGNSECLYRLDLSDGSARSWQSCLVFRSDS